MEAVSDCAYTFKAYRLSDTRFKIHSGSGDASKRLYKQQRNNIYNDESSMKNTMYNDLFLRSQRHYYLNGRDGSQVCVRRKDRVIWYLVVIPETFIDGYNYIHKQLY